MSRATESPLQGMSSPLQGMSRATESALQESPINQAAADMNHRLCFLEELITTLELRLEAVCTPASTTPNKDPRLEVEPNVPTRSEIVRRIEDSSARVKGSSKRIELILERLEL